MAPSQDHREYDTSLNQSLCEVAASHIRGEMILLIEAMDGASVRELAQVMERPADGLYHHLHKLESVGLVEAANKQAGIRGEETRYRLVDRRFREAHGPEQAEAMAKFVRVMSAAVSKAIAHAMANERVHFADEDTLANYVMRFETANLTPEEADKVARHLLAARDVFQEARRREPNAPENAKPHTAALLLSPTTRKKRQPRPSPVRNSQQSDD